MREIEILKVYMNSREEANGLRLVYAYAYAYVDVESLLCCCECVHSAVKFGQKIVYRWVEKQRISFVSCFWS